MERRRTAGLAAVGLAASLLACTVAPDEVPAGSTTQEWTPAASPSPGSCAPMSSPDICSSRGTPYFCTRGQALPPGLDCKPSGKDFNGRGVAACCK